MTPLLAAEGLKLAVPGRTLCSGLSFAVHAGEVWALVGPNGAGKTTLLHALAGLRGTAAGTVRLGDRAIREWTPRERALRIGLLPQDTVDAFPDTAMEVALAGRHPRVARWRAESVEDVQAARDALAAVGCADLAQRNVQTLSGGERRRVAIAMLLAQDPGVMLLDEPANHLDVAQEVRVLALVAARAREDGRAVVMALHDLTLAARHATHALLMGREGARAGPARDMLTERNLSALFGQPLAAIPFEGSTAFVPRGARE